MATVGGVGGSNQIITSDIGGPQDIDYLSSATKVPGDNQSKVVTPGLAVGGIGTGVTYSQPSPLEPSNLVLPSSITDSTNVDITACLVLLMHTAMEMRKDQREQWINQAQNALATSNTAADLQIQAAQDKLIADCVTTGIQAGVSIASCAVSCGEAAYGASAEKSVNAEANSIYGTDEEIKGSGSTNKAKGAEGEEDIESEAQAKSIIGKEGLTSDSLGGESSEIDEGGANKTQKSIAKEQDAKLDKADAKEADTTTQSKESNKTADEKSMEKSKEQLKAKKEYIAQSMASKTAIYQARSQAAKSALDVVGGAGKMVGAGLTYKSELEQAEASKVKAWADFQNTQASDQLDFANELRDYTNSILSTIKDVESARHAASNAIANI
jgi:hypothetical protein